MCHCVCIDSTRIYRFCRHCEASARKSWQSILTGLLRPIVLAMTNLPRHCEQNFQILRGNPLFDFRIHTNTREYKEILDFFNF